LMLLLFALALAAAFRLAPMIDLGLALMGA
jgi:hypothetical protein